MGYPPNSLTTTTLSEVFKKLERSPEGNGCRRGHRREMAAGELPFGLSLFFSFVFFYTMKNCYKYQITKLLHV